MKKKDEKLEYFKENIKSLENKLANGDEITKMNDLHRKGKLKTVDFLWKTWNLTQPKGKPPQDQNLNEQERVDLWVQRLGGCPSHEDYLAFGTNLDNPKFGGARYVGV